MISATATAQMNETWVDYANNYKLTLVNDGTFQFSSATTNTQGSYSVQNNTLYLQDSMGNNYAYKVQNFTNDAMTLVDNLGMRYNYVKSQANANNYQSNSNLPWENPQYLRVLAEKNGYQWRERENQLYVELLQLMIGQKASDEEIAQMRQDFINEFNNNPQNALNDVKAMESAMQQIYSVHDVAKVAMLKEVVSSTFYQSLQQRPELNNYAFVQILNKHIKILSMDNSTQLNLSNHDAQAYINYLQFQAMLAGQNFQPSQQERMAMQMFLANKFTSLPLQQKQTLAFASFIMDNIQRQFSSMTVAQQQQYIYQVQSQMNIQNQQINSQYVNNFWNNANTQSYQSYNNAAALSVSEFEAKMQADRNMFQMMENSLTEQHVTMMNIINADSDYEYVVKYNDY